MELAAQPSIGALSEVARALSAVAAAEDPSLNLPLPALNLLSSRRKDCSQEVSFRLFLGRLRPL